MPIGAISLWLCLPESQHQVLTSPGLLGPATLQGILLAQLPMPAAPEALLLLPHRLLDGRIGAHGQGGAWGATSSRPQPLGSHAQLLAGSPRWGGKAHASSKGCSAVPHFFEGVCRRFGRGRAQMPMGLLGSAVGWPLSKCDGVGAVPTGGWSLSPPPALCQAPGCSWWAGPRVAGEKMLQPPALPLCCC